MTTKLFWLCSWICGAGLLLDPLAAAENLPEGLIASPEPGWPQWRGPRRDGIADETGLLATWPATGPNLLWRIGQLGQGWSSPIIVGQRIYITGDVGDDLVVFALDLDGQPVWRARNGQAWKASFPGARSCCAYSAGRLYHLNGHGRLVCLDANTGHEVWSLDVLTKFGGREITWGWSEGLLVDGPRLIVTPGGTQALLVALDKETGRTVWTSEPLEDDYVSHASPILLRHDGRRLVVNCSSAHGFCVDADTGKRLWSVPLKNQFATNVATPVYGDGRVFFVTAYVPGVCYRLPTKLRGSEPEKLWETTLDSCTGAGLYVNGTLFGSGYRKHKSWLSVDWQSGQTRYESKALTTSSAVYADGRLYCLAEDGTVAMLKPAAGVLEVAGRFRLVPEKVQDAWAYPVLLNGRLYLRHHNALWCYDVRGDSR